MAIELQDILKAFESPLPGENAHRYMAPVGRNLKLPAEGVKTAAVLCLFYPVNGQWHIVFIERSSGNKKDKHSGQIGFPGGMYEPEDADLLTCALREAQEEIGLEIEYTQPIKTMSPLYIPVSNFQVHPFVAYTNHKQEFIPQAAEVNRIMSFSLEELLHPANLKQVYVRLERPSFRMEVPAYSLDRAVIWGATAMMLHEGLSMIKQYLDMP